MSVHNHHNLHPHHHSQIYSRSSNITNLTPNSCLLAVLLVTRCSSGPSLTFHYPPRPRLDSSPLSRSARSTSPTSSSSSSSSGEDDDADENSRTTATAPLLLPLHAAAPVAAAAAAAAAATAASDTDTRSYLSRRGGPGGGEDGGEKDKSSSSSSSRKKPGGYDTVLGFKSDFLAGLLAPKAAVAAKDRFEMSVDDVVFLGAPVHVRPDGLWRKRKKRRSRSTQLDEGEGGEVNYGGSGGAGGGGEIEKGEGERGGEGVASLVETGSETHATLATAAAVAAEDEDADADDERGEDGDDDGGGDGDAFPMKGRDSTMNMFHVVFALNPPELEYHFRTAEMFDHVVKRFSRALKYEQEEDGYVWREAEKISRLKEQAAQTGPARSHPSITKVFADKEPRLELWRTLAADPRSEQPGIRNLPHLHRNLAKQDRTCPPQPLAGPLATDPNRLRNCRSPVPHGPPNARPVRILPAPLDFVFRCLCPVLDWVGLGWVGLGWFCFVWSCLIWTESDWPGPASIHAHLNTNTATRTQPGH